MYLGESRNKLPRVNTMPSLKPPLNDAPSLIDLLQPYVRENVEVYRCPDDRITYDAVGTPAGFETYFDREGSSYQYNPTLAALYAGKQIQDTLLYRQGNQNVQPVMSDYEAFHNPPGRSEAMNHLFADWHVGDFD